MHADAQSQAAGLTAQSVLDGDGTLQRLDCAGKLNQEAVACGLENTPVMGSGKWLDDVRAQRPDPRQRARLVRCNHGGIADNIGRHDTRKTALLLGHALLRYDEHKVAGFGGGSEAATQPAG